MRFASSTSCAAVSSSTRPMSLRNSCSESVDVSIARVGTAGASSRSAAAAGHDLDLLLLERLVQLVELPGLEVEVVERERDLLRGHRAVLATRLDQRARLVRVEDVVDALWHCLNLGQTLPHPSRLPIDEHVLASRQCCSGCGQPP